MTNKDEIGNLERGKGVSLGRDEQTKRRPYSHIPLVHNWYHIIFPLVISLEPSQPAYADQKAKPLTSIFMIRQSSREVVERSGQ